MARGCASTVCEKHDNQKRKERFEQETVPELTKQINALIEKIGYVNVIILLDAINAMQIVDVDTPYRDKDYRNGWFTLKGNALHSVKGVDYASSSGVLVDDKLAWRERWVDIFGKMEFGMK